MFTQYNQGQNKTKQNKTKTQNKNSHSIPVDDKPSKLREK